MRDDEAAVSDVTTSRQVARRLVDLLEDTAAPPGQSEVGASWNGTEVNAPAQRRSGLSSHREGTRASLEDGDDRLRPLAPAPEAGGAPGRGRPGRGNPWAARLRSLSRVASDTATSRLRLHRLHLVVVGLVLAVGLVIAGWALLRARAVAVTVPLAVQTSTAAVPNRPGPPEQGATSGSSPPAASRGTSPAPGIVVHVAGAVRRPGVVHLPSGARVLDAIRAAGGRTDRANAGQLNLARVLSDGQQVIIGTRAHPRGEIRDGGAVVGADRGGTPPGAVNPGERLDLNQATAAQLDQLPGVGPVTAERIMAWRSEHGRFSRLEELQEIEGIGPKTFARLASLLHV